MGTKIKVKSSVNVGASSRSSAKLTSNSNAPRPMLALMMVPFTVIGTVLAVSSARMLFTLMLMQGWNIVPATILKADLSQDGKTQSVDASYTYVVDGKTYTSTRFSMYTADNIGSFFEDAAQELQGYMNRKQPYPLHVNPQDPSQAILKPVLRLGRILFSLLFIMLFGGLCAGTIVAYGRKLLQSRKEANLAKQYPNEPWKQRLDWLANRIRATRLSDPARVVAFAIYWNASTFPIWMIIPRELGARHYDVLMWLFVPLIGAGFAFWAVAALTGARGLGGAYLHLDTMPGKPGASLRGHIYAPQTLEGVPFVNLSLRCETYDGGPPPQLDQGTGYSLNEDGSVNIWQTESTVPVVRDPSGKGDAMLDVAFDIPAGLPASQNDSNLRCRWLLAATARVKGTDSSVEMEVPVFAN